MGIEYRFERYKKNRFNRNSGEFKGNGYRDYSYKKGGKFNGQNKRSDFNKSGKDLDQQETVVESETPKETYLSILKRSSANEQKVAQDSEIDIEITSTTDKTNIDGSTEKNSKAPNLEDASQEEVTTQTAATDNKSDKKQSSPKRKPQKKNMKGQKPKSDTVSLTATEDSNINTTDGDSTTKIN